MADLEKLYTEVKSCSIALNRWIFFPGKILVLPSFPLQATEKPEEDSTGPNLPEGNPMSKCSWWFFSNFTQIYLTEQHWQWFSKKETNLPLSILSYLITVCKEIFLSLISKFRKMPLSLFSKMFLYWFLLCLFVHVCPCGYPCVSPTDCQICLLFR